MKRSQVISGLLTILIVTAVVGLARRFVEADLPDRVELDKHVKRLQDLPDVLGDWVRMADNELPKSAQRILNCHGFINQTYRSIKTGGKVSFAVLYGPRGPIAVHTPEICYSGAGTRPLGERKSVDLSSADRTDSFWTLLLSRGGDPAPQLEVWYGWSDGGNWIASEHPRFWMTDSLYKIQMAGTPAKENVESDCKNFMKALLPELRQRLRGST